MDKLPRWVFWVIGAVLVIVVCALLKVNISVGSQGIHVTQELIK